MVPRGPMRKCSELFQSLLRFVFGGVLESPPITRTCVTVSIGMSECWIDQVFPKMDVVALHRGYIVRVRLREVQRLSGGRKLIPIEMREYWDYHPFKMVEILSVKSLTV